MPDRETVINGLERVSYYFKSLLSVGWQGDADIYKEYREKIRMAIALLKEQDKQIDDLKAELAKSEDNFSEYVEMMQDTREPVAPEWRLGIPFCGKCGRQLRGFFYCPDCGRKVKWNA